MDPKNWKKLTPEEARIIEHAGTEAPWSGEYVKHHADGTYHCKRCGAALFASDTKFSSGCGWPSFDDAIDGAVLERPDPDGSRTEIVCAACKGHLGHVFRGEGFTPANTRHCVNSLSIEFEPTPTTKLAYFAGGCFWGVEYYLEQVPGVLKVESGYMGGHVDEPTYEQVCAKRTGHAETVRVEYDPSKISYEALAKRFFEIHDPTQVNRQGPDIGPQYRSAIFVNDASERATAQGLIEDLKKRGFDVATTVEKAGAFWVAEAYHQNYYQRSGKIPYCHAPVERFGTSAPQR